MNKLLSKTKLMRAYQCPKSIWLSLHEPSLETPITADQQARFDVGSAVGVEARKLFPGGILVDNAPWDFFGSLKKTRELIGRGETVLYEAAFEHNGCYARADIIKLSPESQRWQIFEVKSSTKIKPEHLDDVGLQAWVIAGSGLPIESISILHLNPDCRYPDLSNLFKSQEVTAELRANYLSISPRIKNIFDIIKKESAPPTDIGKHCFSPYECGFKNHCFNEKKLPEVSVFQLPKIGDRAWELYREGILALDDARLSELSVVQSRMVEVHRSGQRFFDEKGIRSALVDWKFPLVFLDFETIAPALPRFRGCGPYTNVPFQFSVHVLESLNAEITHFDFLQEDNQDPRIELIPRLLAACQGHGSIVSYYKQFESSRIKEMAESFPESALALLALNERMVDPLPIFREFVYDKAFQGSFSLKAVAPAILGETHSYEGMAVSNGLAAQVAFTKLTNPTTESSEKTAIRQAMLAYCEKDTLVMVELVKWLFSFVQVEVNR